MLEASERRRPLTDGQIEQQFRKPDLPILAGLHQGCDNHPVEEHVLAAGRQADQLVRQRTDSLSRAAGPGSPFGAGFIVADESKDGESTKQPCALVQPSGNIGIERADHENGQDQSSNGAQAQHAPATSAN